MPEKTVIEELNELRKQVKAVARSVDALRTRGGVGAETIDNVTLSYRHLEDASMRLGKAIQAEDGGVSVYDRSTTVGA